MLSVPLLGLVIIRVRCVTKFVVKLSIADFALKCDTLKYEDKCIYMFASTHNTCIS